MTNWALYRHFTNKQEISDKIIEKMFEPDEQRANEEMSELYQNVIAMGPVKYTEDIFKVMLKNGQLNENAKKMGASALSVQLFAPLQLIIRLSDGGADRDILLNQLRQITEDFEERYTNDNNK